MDGVENLEECKVDKHLKFDQYVYVRSADDEIKLWADLPGQDLKMLSRSRRDAFGNRAVHPEKSYNVL